MSNNFDEDRVQKILSTLKGSAETPVQQENKSSFDENRVSEIMSVLRGTPEAKEEPKKSEEFSWPRFIGEKFTKGVLNLADFPQLISDSRGDPNPHPEYGDIGIEDAMGQNDRSPKEPNRPIVSSTVESLAKKAGVDLHSQGDGNTTAQRIVGKGAEFAGSSLIPGGGIAGLAKNAAIGGVIGAETGALEELDVPEPVAALMSLATVLAGAPALKGAISKALSRTPNLSDAEKKVANYLQQVLGEEGVATVGKNISEAPGYKMTGYEPTTAEVSNNPFISTLHRLRQGIPGTGLQERAAAQNSAIHNISDKLSLDASKSSHLKETIKNELSDRKALRRAETKPLYEELRKDKSPVDTSNVKSFIDQNKIVKGDKRKDLDTVEKLMKPTEKLTTAEEQALANYESEVKSIKNSKMSEANKEQALEKLNKPKDNKPTVADLDEARQNINDKIKALRRKGADNRVRQLEEAKTALDKDLEPFPKQKEVTAKYAELSKPVNNILEHPTLKNIPKSRLNNIFESLFSNKSSANMKALKQVLKYRPGEWKGVQDASVEYLMKSIKNAGAEGGRNVLSYHKLDKFIEKHGQALSDVFNKDQITFLEELKNALKGRNIAETSGIEKQSATYGKLITGTQLSGGFGTKLLKGATYIPHALPVPKVGKATGEALRSMLGNYIKSREADVMGVLDNFLKNPEYAPKLLNHTFKTQSEFNGQMNRFLKQATSVTASAKDKKDES